MSDVKQRKSMNGHHQRKPRNAQPAHVRANGHLPPSATLVALGAPGGLVADVQRFHDLKVAERAQARLAAEAQTKADAAAAGHARKVKEALANNEDPRKVKSDVDKHKADAEAAVGYHRDANNERERLGWGLGPQLESAAPTLFAAAEDRIEATSTQLRGSVAILRDAWGAYSEALELRKWLSHVALDGGMLPAFHGESPLPAPVADALAALDHALGELDRLKADEAEVVAFREANA